MAHELVLPVAGRLLTDVAFQRLPDVPPEVEEFRIVTRACDRLARARRLSGATVRHRLAVLSSLFELVR